MTDAELNRLRELANAATPGPWEAVTEDDPRGMPSAFYRAIIGLACGPDGNSAVVATDEQSVSPAQHVRNARFIAEARTALPALIAEVEWLRERCDQDGIAR